MQNFDLQQIIQDFADLPAAREPLLLALPQFVRQHFRAPGIVSVFHAGDLNVLAAGSSVGIAQGEQPPAAQKLAQVISAGTDSVQFESDELSDRPHVAACVLKELGLPVAILQLHSRRPLPAASMALLVLFSDLLSSRLSTLASSSQAVAQAELVTALMTAESVMDGAQKGLAIIAEHGRATAGKILQVRLGVMEPVATFGHEPDTDRARELGIGQRFPEGVAWQACMSGETITLDPDTSGAAPRDRALTVVQPLGWGGVYRYALILRMRPRKTVTPSDQALLEAMATQVHLALDRLQTDLVQDRLLSLQETVVGIDAVSMYQHILEEATELIPGAQAGSLLVRSSADQPFRFVAAVEHNLAELSQVMLDEENMLEWHGRGKAVWKRGEARIISHAQGRISDVSMRAARRDSFVSDADRIMSNLGMPVTYRGDVLAYINLDNFYNDGAFGEDSLRGIRQFAPVVANMLITARQRDQILDMARTDSLTGLPNRRGSDQALAEQLQHSLERDEPFAVLVMDLKNFKNVNDTFGHETGDRTLKQVAQVLQQHARAGDTVTRWGGDEFAVILPATHSGIGERVAARLQEAVATVSAGDVQLGIDIGMAAFPEDAGSIESLLQVADKRMYAQKRSKP